MAKYTARVRIDHTFVFETDENIQELAETDPWLLDTIVLEVFTDLDDWGSDIEIETWDGEFV